MEIVEIYNLKVPAEWPLMNYKEQEHFLNRVGREPDNIIAFRPVQHIDLTNCF